MWDDAKAPEPGREPYEVSVEHAGVEEILEEVAPLRGQLAHDAEVEVATAAIVEDPHVAGVHVAVERPVNHHGLRPDLCASAEHGLAIDAATFQFVEVVHRDPFDELHADGARPAVVQVHLGRRDHRVVAERADVDAELVLAPCLERGVELLAGHRVEIGNDLPRA